MGDVLDRWRVNQSLLPYDEQTQNMMIASFVHSLDKAEIPYRLYGELYERCVRTRAAAMKAGEFVYPFGVELMISEWPDLREELRQREIERGRTLTTHAPSTCPLCFGTGKEYKFENGQPVGVTVKSCDHNGTGDTPYLLDGKPATYEDFQAVMDRNKNAADEQAKAQDETAEGILRRFSADLFTRADETADEEERAHLRDLWLMMLRAARYAREQDSE